MPPTTAIVGEPWTYDASALDPEVAGVTYTLAASPAGAAIDPVLGQRPRHVERPCRLPQLEARR